MRLRFLNFVFFISLVSFSAQAVEDVYAEKKEAMVRSLQKLQKNRPELKEPLEGIDYLEQGLRIQAHFSREAAHETYNLPLPDDVFKSMVYDLKVYKQEQPLEPQEATQAKFQTLFKKRQPVLRPAFSNAETQDITRSTSPLKHPEEPEIPIAGAFGSQQSVQEKISIPNENLLSFKMAHPDSKKDDEKTSPGSPTPFPPFKRLAPPKNVLF
ncbi:MAG: hypothetical protein ACRCYZ_05975 [Alphaproteobacteria bacterium]